MDPESENMKVFLKTVDWEIPHSDETAIMEPPDDEGEFFSVLVDLGAQKSVQQPAIIMTTLLFKEAFERRTTVKTGDFILEVAAVRDLFPEISETPIC